MRYYVVDLGGKIEFHTSGKSINSEPLLHQARTLYDLEIFLGVEGRLFLRQQEEFCVKKGEVLIHNKGEFQTGTRAAPCTFYWLHFDGNIQIYQAEDEAKKACEGKEEWIYFAEYFSLSNMERIVPILSELNHRRFEKGGILVRNALTKALLAELAEQCARGVETYAEDKRFAELRAWVDLYYSKSFTIVELAEKFEYNPKYVSALFKKYTGQTPTAYIERKRLDKAKQLLAQGSDSVKQIAHAVGFSDEYYFMRRFKKDVDLTPSEYRERFSGCRYT